MVINERSNVKEKWYRVMNGTVTEQPPSLNMLLAIENHKKELEE